MKRLHLLLMLLQVPLDAGLLFLSIALAWKLRFSRFLIAVRPVEFSMSFSEFLLRALPFLVCAMLFLALAGLYSARQRKLGDELVRLFFVLSSTIAGVALWLLFTQDIFDSRFLVVISWAVALCALGAGRIFLRGVRAWCYAHGYGTTALAIIGNTPAAQYMAKTLLQKSVLGYSVCGVWESFALAKNDSAFFQVDELLLMSPYAQVKDTQRALEYARQAHKRVMYTTDIFGTYAAGAEVRMLAGETVAQVVHTPLEGWGRVLKRIFDIVFSVGVLVVLSPLYALIALCVLFETGRPILYKNERVGIRGAHIVVSKFRSMKKEYSTGMQFGASGEEALKLEQQLIANQNTRTGPIYKIGNDPRVTWFGAFLRRWSLDELPQFWNVLRGDMSVVGPRPHQVREVAQYAEKHPEVFTLKPGITGLAQVSGRSDLSFEDEMRLDMLYTRTWSLWLDCIVIIKTPFVVLRKRKAL